MTKTKTKPKGKAQEEEQEEEVQEEEETTQDDDTNEDEETDGDDKKDARIAELEAQNKELLAVQPAPKTPPVKVTSSYLRGLSASERKAIEEASGHPFETILNRVEVRENQETVHGLQSRNNISDALEVASESDPNVVKMKGHMRAYLGKLPLEVRADPAQLDKHVADAKTFARGKIAEGKGPGPGPKQIRKGGKGFSEPNPAEGEPVFDEEDEDAVKPGTEVKIGKLNLKVSDILPKDIVAKTKHPTDPNGIEFKDFDQEPKFA